MPKSSDNVGRSGKRVGKTKSWGFEQKDRAGKGRSFERGKKSGEGGVDRADARRATREKKRDVVIKGTLETG